MPLEIHLRSGHLSNSSATSGFIWEEFDFHACDNFAERKYIWAVGTMLCFVFGFPACVAILWNMFKTHQRGTPITPNNFFILNITIMDVIFLAFIPLGVVNHLIWHSWGFEASWNFVYSLNTTGRPLIMACVCLDCFIAVVHPITYHKKKSLTWRVVMVAVIWTLTLAIGIVYFLYFKFYFSLSSSVPCIIAIAVITICDAFIFHALVKSDFARKNIHPQKQRAIQTLVNSLVLTVSSYLPPMLLIGIGGIVSTDFTSYLCTIAIPLTIVNTWGSAVMPILHLSNNGKFDCFRLRCCKKF